MGDTVRVSERPSGIYTQDISVRGHKLVADEPTDLGGEDRGATPFELVCAGLGACTTITLRMYAARKNWPVDHIEVDVNYRKDGQGKDRKDIFHRAITITGDLDESQIKRMLVIAGKCPVHKMLETDNEIVTELAG